MEDQMIYNNKSITKNILLPAVLSIFLLTAACSSDDNPVDSNGNTAKVAGRISSSGGSTNSLAKISGIQAAEVILAQVQADGSLKTVSTQSVQTNAEGKFVVETELSGTSNLVVVATQGSAQLKAIVSAAVESGTTVYAPPLNEESTAETNIYVKLVSQGNAEVVDATDLKILIDAESAAYIKSNNNYEAEFISALNARYNASAQAAGNAYFGLTSSQIQAVLNARAEAKAQLDADLYNNSSDSDEEVDDDVKRYEESCASIYTGNNIDANIYAEMMRIAGTSYLNVSASMDADARLAISKTFYKRYSFVLNYAMKQEFQAAGASESQINAAASAGSTLYASIKSSSDMNQINDAFVQYHSSIKAQLKLALSAYADIIETVDVQINSASSAKAILDISLTGTVSLNTIVNAYVTFYNSVKSETEAAMVGASSAQVKAATQILIMANMN